VPDNSNLVALTDHIDIFLEKKKRLYEDECITAINSSHAEVMTQSQEKRRKILGHRQSSS